MTTRRNVNSSHSLKDGNYELRSSNSFLSANVEEIFKICPSRYKGPERPSSSATRGPAFYDQHLSRALLLKKTVFCPNLVDQLCGVAELAWKEARLPNVIGGEWKPASEIKSELLRLTDKLPAEVDVAVAYQNNVFPYIAPIASVLEFPSSSWRVQFIELSKSDSTHLDGKAKERRKSNYALADSILMINPELHEEGISSSTSKEIKTVVEYFKRIIPFEFKSLASGSYGTMLGILGHTLEEVFPWQGCLERYCAYEHGSKLGRRPVTGDPLGFDADVQPEISVWAGCHRNEFERTGLKQKEKNIVHGRNMLQQLWAEMVKCDATYAVVNSGNYELIFLRRREIQTLYISDIIKPHGTATSRRGRGYYQLHIGLYIAAIRDARSRARQLEEQDMLPNTWTRPYDCGYGRYKPAEIPKPDFDYVIFNYPNLCLGLAKGSSINPRFATHKPYHRSGSPIDSERAFFFLEVDKIISTNEYVGTMIVQGHTFPFAVVIKVANEQNATSNLYEEYKVHLGLLAKHKTNMKSKHDMMIQRVYGFFTLERGAGSKDNFSSVLLLEYAGEEVRQLDHLTRSQKLSIRKTLTTLHRLGFVHGALERHKIRIDNNQEVWLADLSQVRQGIGADLDEERGKLQRWLEYPKKNNPSHSVDLGPIPFRFDDAKVAFQTITAWMVQGSWLGTARCCMTNDKFGNKWLVAKFFSEEHVNEFMVEWCSGRRPTIFHDIQSVYTYFNRELQGSQDSQKSQA